MKAILFLAILFLSAAAIDSLQAQETRVRLTAKTVSSSRDVESRWKTDYGSYDRDVFQLRVVQVSFQCTQGTGKGKLLVQWIGKNKARNSAAELVSAETKDLDLKPAAAGTIEFAECFAETDAKYKALGERDRDGFRYGGWIARIIDANGKVLAEQSSSQPYLKKFSADTKAPENRVQKP